MHLGLENKVRIALFLYLMSVLRKISLFHQTSFPLPIPESSVRVTFGVTGVLSDVVNEI